jgi:hypothetical protein
MSDGEIDSGKRWDDDEIAKALDDADFGIARVTASNQHERLMMFESGALAKRLEVSQVVPLRTDRSSSPSREPLASFQGCLLNEPAMQKLVKTYGSAGVY